MVDVWTVLDTLTDVLTSLTIIGTGLTVITYLIFPKLRTYPIKLILYLALSICLGNIFVFIDFKYGKNKNICLPSSILLHYFLMAQFMWTLSVAINCHQMIVKKNRSVEVFEKYYHLLSWGVPIIFVLGISITKNYVLRSYFCYLRDGFPMIFGLLAPAMLVCLVNLIIFILVAIEINDTMRKSPSEYKKKRVREFRVYFSIFVTLGISWVFGFARYIPGVVGEICLALFGILVPAQGILIFIIYCCNKQVLHNYLLLFSAILPCDGLVKSMSKPNSTNEKTKSENEIGAVAMGALRENSYQVNKKDDSYHSEVVNGSPVASITILHQPTYEDPQSPNSNKEDNMTNSNIISNSISNSSTSTPRSSSDSNLNSDYSIDIENDSDK